MSSGMEFPKRIMPPKTNTRRGAEHQGATEPERKEPSGVPAAPPAGWRGPGKGADAGDTDPDSTAAVAE